LDTLSRHPLVRNPRRLGTIVAAEIGTGESAYLDSAGPRLRSFALERGVLIRPLGNTVYVMPPYCIDDADLGAIYAA
ncbi:aminotransferase class III-fold pyridoxal phosphate-dependent enzyme, partial [Escherichia coli]|nr:aminotransferase class III-fold pyridoxal phosphate-dependent enzyme [Escherichia coli]